MRRLLSLNGGFPTHGAKPRHGPRDRPTIRHGSVRTTTIDDHHCHPTACCVRLRRADHRRRGTGYGTHSHSGGSHFHGVHPHRRGVGIDVRPPSLGETLPNDLRSRQTSHGFGPRCGHHHPGCGWRSGDPSPGRRPGPVTWYLRRSAGCAHS